jgi:hypothetical protein
MQHHYLGVLMAYIYFTFTYFTTCICRDFTTYTSRCLVDSDVTKPCESTEDEVYAALRTLL